MTEDFKGLKTEESRQIQPGYRWYIIEIWIDFSRVKVYIEFSLRIFAG